MSLGFDVFALLALGCFYLVAHASKPRREGNRQQPQRQAKRPVASTKPAWALAREKRAIAEGKHGEELVQRVLHELHLPALHDIMLEDDKGPTQVDHLVKTSWGVAVLETKHYSGFIFGNPSGAMWTQRFGKNDEVYDVKFRSPIRQNYRHTKAVQHVIKGLGVSVQGFIVFSSDATIGDTMKDFIVSLPELGQKLRTVDRPRPEPANLEIAWARLRQVSIRAEGRREEHLAMVKARPAQQPSNFT